MVEDSYPYKLMPLWDFSPHYGGDSMHCFDQKIAGDGKHALQGHAWRSMIQSAVALFFKDMYPLIAGGTGLMEKRRGYGSTCDASSPIML